MPCRASVGQLKVRKEVHMVEWVTVNESGHEVNSNCVFYLSLFRLTSGLEHPIKNLLEFSQKYLVIVVSDWFQMQGFGNSVHFQDVHY